jgi:hypothetical protein
MFRRSAAAVLFSVAALSACASAPPPPPQPLGLAGLPAQINVTEWPFWVDIPIESKDYDRTWKTVIDVVSERAAIGVLDRESGYVRTEWRPVEVSAALYAGSDEKGRPIYANQTGEQRYTFRIRTSEGKIRMGIESRLMPSQRWASGLRNIPNAPWVGIHRELQDRLVTR